MRSGPPTHPSSAGRRCVDGIPLVSLFVLTQLDSNQQCKRTFSSRPIGYSRRRTASVPARSLAPGRKPGP